MNLINSSLKTPVNITAESFKLGIPKNDRKTDITFDFLTLQEGPGGWGGLSQLFNCVRLLMS